MIINHSHLERFFGAAVPSLEESVFGALYSYSCFFHSGRGSEAGKRCLVPSSEAALKEFWYEP
jgi:hypothetical protein